MKPRTKLQKHVAELSATLPPLNKRQIAYGTKHCFGHYAITRYQGYYCSECGHWWKGDASKCPNCSSNLELLETRKCGWEERSYYGVVTTCGGMQVIRTFMGYAIFKVGNEADYSFIEVTQRWINAKGVEVVMARPRSICRYLDSWQTGQPMTVRSDTKNDAFYPTVAATYACVRSIAELKRNGFKGDFHGISAHYLFPALLKRPICETMLKSGQYAMLKYFAERNESYQKYAPLVKICNRHGYIIQDANLWIDLIQLLDRCGKDIHSPKYICPTDLSAAHDYWLKKRNSLIEKERIDRAKKEALDNEDKFTQMKSKFFGISATDGEITIKVLESVIDHVIEGERLHHCVGKCNYALRPDSLILSARIDGKSIETIEINLDTMTIAQCRGLCNQSSEYHDRIVELMNNNIHLIRRRKSA